MKKKENGLEHNRKLCWLFSRGKRKKNNCEITVSAQVMELVCCKEQFGYRRDYSMEDKIRSEIGHIYLSWDEVDRKYEEKLYIYAEYAMFSYVMEDEWTGKPILMSHQKWYEYKLKVSYECADRTIEKVVDYESEYNNICIGNLFLITVKQDDPESVISISKYGKT